MELCNALYDESVLMPCILPAGHSEDEDHKARWIEDICVRWPNKEAKNTYWDWDALEVF